MIRRCIGGAAFAALIATYTSLGAQAEVTRIEITSRTDVLAGKSFGSVGPYQKLSGKVYFAVDPTHPRNNAIVDLDKAARDATGRVEFSADLYVLAPADAARGNGVALFDVLNRGRKNILRDFNRSGQALDPSTEADFGDGFLMRQGYTLVLWAGSSTSPTAGDFSGSMRRLRWIMENRSPAVFPRALFRTPPIRCTRSTIWAAMPTRPATRLLIRPAQPTR